MADDIPEAFTIPRDCLDPDGPRCVPMARFVWEKAIRHADLPRELKGAALMLATWGNEFGESIFPGELGLARALPCSERQARRYFDALRDAGYVARVKPGSKRNRLADRYRLTRPWEPSPDTGVR